MQYRSLVMSDITSDFPGLKSYSRRPICVPNGHKHPIGTGDTLLEYKKDKPKNQILFFSAISFTLVLVPVTFTILTLCADFPQSVADFHKSKTKKILSIPKCWVGRFRSELVKSNACLRFIDSATRCRVVDNCFTINEIANCLWRISTKDKCFVT